MLLSLSLPVLAFFSLAPTLVTSLATGHVKQGVSSRTDVTLADGTSMQYSAAPLADGLSWQASG